MLGHKDDEDYWALKYGFLSSARVSSEPLSF